MPNPVLLAAGELAKLARLNAYCANERAVNGYILRLTRIDEQRRLIVARRDRPPSLEEITLVAQAAGAPLDCEPVLTYLSVTATDRPYQRLPAMVVGWREA